MMLVRRRVDAKICHSKRFGAVLRLAIHLNRVRQRRAVTAFRVHRTSVVLFALEPGFRVEIVV